MQRLVRAFILLSTLLAAAVLPGSTGPSAAAQSARPTAALTAPAAPGSLQDRPNIILITTDDQAADDMRFMPLTRQAIGQKGVTFTDAVAQYPLCCPARASILTGQLAHNNNVLSNKGASGGYQALRPLNAMTLPNWLQAVGYRTTFAGKYLNGYGYESKEEVPAGWNDWHGAVDRVYNFWGNIVNDNGFPSDHTGEYQAALVQESAEDAIRQAADTPAPARQPFFIYQSFLAPHAACAAGYGCWAPPQAETRADEWKYSKLPLDRPNDASFDERAVADKPRYIQNLPRLSNADKRKMLAFHRGRAASLQAIDRYVAKTVALLESTGQLDNTLIIFTSDNGYLLGEHRAFEKILPYEQSLKVPLLMRGPGVPTNVKVAETAALVDLPATIAEAAGAQPMLTQDGRSLLPVANGLAPGYAALNIEAGPVLGAPLGTFLYNGVRTRRYTYVEYPNTKEAELYDRYVDPGQMDNVAYRPTHRATRAAMATLLAQLRSCEGEQCRPVSARIPGPQPPQGPLHPDEVAGIGTATQVVTVTAPQWSSRRGRAVAWVKRGRSWSAVRSFPVELGRAGLSRPGAPRHQRSLTPSGIFAAASAVGISRNPGARVPFRRLDRDDRWPFDRRSQATYNVFQPKRSARASWAKDQELVFARHAASFRHALVLNQNLPRGVRRVAARNEYVAAHPADVRQGSLMLHTGRPVGLHGWMSAAPTQVAWLLRWVNPKERTRFVVGTPDFLRRTM